MRVKEEQERGVGVGVGGWAAEWQSGAPTCLGTFASQKYQEILVPGTLLAGTTRVIRIRLRRILQQRGAALQPPPRKSHTH